jgi:hypothetical protein
VYRGCADNRGTVLLRRDGIIRRLLWAAMSRNAHCASQIVPLIEDKSVQQIGTGHYTGRHHCQVGRSLPVQRIPITAVDINELTVVAAP